MEEDVIQFGIDCFKHGYLMALKDTLENKEYNLEQLEELSIKEIMEIIR